ncbi:amidase domain-containing protein [Sporosalibacterium faouarense]|uniref:amidase domain-containing protein n=1 Tax=Sporosalibacterium faouarense TaxID=516123 RepID=UPI00141CC793|nr:amidase domain-containing protein [Sporosalibacterium faouarense]MTI49001.1 amidase domain-containing protein [Bacillota bacterium]
MIIILRKSRLYLILIIIAFLIIASFLFKKAPITASVFNKNQAYEIVNDIIRFRNNALLEKDLDSLNYMYNKNKKYGLWAYEHELKKMKYLHIWSEKQGVKFKEVDTIIRINYTKETDEGIQVSFTASTEYEYYYLDQPDKINMFRIGTYHLLDLEKQEDKWLITRDWYNDPFADSLHLDKINSEEVNEFIINHEARDISGINERRKSAIEYADKYCGAASDEEYGLKYNSKYKDYNNLGGDCANFASQILHEGGGFKKTYSWNYEKDGTRAWVNAQGFKDYMVNSGRASVIARGSYDSVYKSSYKLLPGDFVAYEKKGKIVHISVVTGVDSKGYSLVNCHNTDRYRVPWELGWSDNNIKFWLVRVHY